MPQQAKRFAKLARVTTISRRLPGMVRCASQFLARLKVAEYPALFGALYF
jgi:hypothetical protein